jgi:hypothetical protein
MDGKIELNNFLSANSFKVPFDPAVLKADTAGTDGSGTLVTLHFQVVGKAGQIADIAFTEGLLFNNQGQVIESDWGKCSTTLKILDQADSGTEKD